MLISTIQPFSNGSIRKRQEESAPKAVNVFLSMQTPMVVLKPVNISIHLNPTALRKAKIVYNFGLSECNRVNYRNFLSATGLTTETK